MGGGGKLQVHYDEMTQASTMLAQEAQNINDMINQIHQRMGELEGGQWQGQAAQAFYSDMQDIVFPGMKTLIQRLEDASSLMKQLNELFGHTENQVGDIFKKKQTM